MDNLCKIPDTLQGLYQRDDCGVLICQTVVFRTARTVSVRPDTGAGAANPLRGKATEPNCLRGLFRGVDVRDNNPGSAHVQRLFDPDSVQSGNSGQHGHACGFTGTDHVNQCFRAVTRMLQIDGRKAKPCIAGRLQKLGGGGLNKGTEERFVFA